MLKINPQIKIAGSKIQKKKTEKPAKTIKTSNKNPAINKIVLTIAPRMREIKFEKNTSRYFPGSKPLG